MNLFAHRRIMIVGNNGSGKSFLAGKIADITGLPLVHLDAIYWRPNWEAPTPAEWADMQRELVMKDSWIIDGNHSGTMEIRFDAADLVIFLDFDRLTCLMGVLKRHGKKRADMPDHLADRLDGEFVKFLKGLWTFRKTRRKMILALHERDPAKAFLVIRSRRAMRKCLEKWEQERGMNIYA